MVDTVQQRYSNYLRRFGCERLSFAHCVLRYSGGEGRLGYFSPRRMYAPRAICSACVIFSFLNKYLSKKNSGSTGPIFTKFSPCGRYLIVNYRFDHLFLQWLKESCHSNRF